MGRPGGNFADLGPKRFFSHFGSGAALSSLQLLGVMQNKPNLLDTKMIVSSVKTKHYENNRLRTRHKNKPNQTQLVGWASAHRFPKSLYEYPACHEAEPKVRAQRARPRIPAGVPKTTVRTILTRKHRHRTLLQASIPPVIRIGSKTSISVIRQRKKNCIYELNVILWDNSHGGTNII